MFERLKLSFGIIFFYGLLGVAQEKITKADYGEEKVTVFRVKNFFGDLIFMGFYRGHGVRLRHALTPTVGVLRVKHKSATLLSTLVDTTILMCRTQMFFFSCRIRIPRLAILTKLQFFCAQIRGA